MEHRPFIISIFIAVLLALLGTAIKYHKAYWLISGYNTMSKEKKKNVDIKSLGEFMANISFIISGLVLIASGLMLLEHMLAALIVFFLIMPVSIYTIIKAQAYDGNTKKPDGTMKTGAKILVGVVVGLLVLIMAGVGTLLYFSNEPANYFIQKDSFRISGLYGEEINLSEITSITMKDQIPEIQSKSNGSSLGNMKKGYYKLRDVGKAKLFVDSKNPPFIFLDTNSGLKILNTKKPAETMHLYERLLEAWKSKRS